MSINAIQEIVLLKDELENLKENIQSLDRRLAILYMHVVDELDAKDGHEEV